MNKKKKEWWQEKVVWNSLESHIQFDVQKLN